MGSNVDYTICPECLELNSAMVWFVSETVYEIVCRHCAHEFEWGRLPWESVRAIQPHDVYHNNPDDGTRYYRDENGWLLIADDEEA